MEPPLGTQVLQLAVASLAERLTVRLPAVTTARARTRSVDRNYERV